MTCLLLLLALWLCSLIDRAKIIDYLNNAGVEIAVLNFLYSDADFNERRMDALLAYSIKACLRSATTTCNR